MAHLHYKSHMSELRLPPSPRLLLPPCISAYCIMRCNWEYPQASRCAADFAISPSQNAIIQSSVQSLEALALEVSPAVLFRGMHLVGLRWTNLLSAFLCLNLTPDNVRRAALEGCPFLDLPHPTSDYLHQRKKSMEDAPTSRRTMAGSRQELGTFQPKGLKRSTMYAADDSSGTGGESRATRILPG